MSETLSTIAESNWGNHNGIASVAKYNPHLWSPEELRSIFVARQRELATILQVLQSAAPSVAPQHLLITGQRGMGKSTLLQRVALSVEDDIELSKTWLPLRFPEEQYTVSTPAELWTNVIGALADALERQGYPTMEIDAEILRISGMSAANGEEEGLQWLHQWCIDNNRRLLLLIDSTDLLFSNLSEGSSSKRGKQGGGASALWRVRKALLHSPHFLWLGGSYQPLEVHGLYDDAFLDFFQLIELRPLSLVEMQNAIQAMARIFGAGRGLKGDEAEAEVKRMLDARPERLRAMRQLTGGNPRTTVMLYELFAAGGRDNVRADLERLLDTMTPLYKSKLEVLADQPRKVLAHVMEHWAPITAKALAQAAALSPSTISAQLSRLEQEGLIEKTTLSGTKRYGYQCGERFFNIWYLMRNAPRGARARVGWLVEFMRLWYSNDELQGLARARCGIHREGLLCDGSELEYSRAIARAMPKDAQDRHLLDWTVFLQARKGPSYKEIFEIEGDDADYSTPDVYLSRFEALSHRLSSAKLTLEDKQKWIYEIKSAIHLTLVEKEEIATKCEQLTVEELSGIRSELEESRTKLIATHKSEGLDLVEKAVLHGNFFPDCPDSQLAFTQMMNCFAVNPDAFILSLWCLTRRCKDILVEDVCKKAIEIAPASGRPWHYLGNLLSDQPDRLNNAEDAYLKAIELDPKWATPRSSLGRLLGNRLNRLEEAEAAIRQSIELDSENAIHWMSLGYLLEYKLDRSAEAEDAFRKVIKIDPNIPWLWDCLGDVLSRLNHFDEAEAAYRKAIELDPKWVLPWCDLAKLFRFKLNRQEDAEAAYRTAIELDPKDARSHDNLGDFMSELNRFEEAEKAYRKATELDPKWAEPWSNLSYLLSYELNRLEEAEAVLRKAIELNINSPELWDGLGNLLGYKLNRPVEAESAFRKAIDLDGSMAGPWGRLGDILSRDSERLDEAEDAYVRAIELEPNWEPPSCALGSLLGFKLNRPEEAERIYRQAIELNPNLANLWNELGVLLEGKLFRFDEAEIAFKKASELEPKWVLPWFNLGGLLAGELNRLSEAEIAYRKAIELEPERVESYMALGSLLRFELNRQEEAEAIYRKAISVKPNEAAPWGCLGDLLSCEFNRFGEAEAAYLNAIELNPAWAAPHDALGDLLCELNRWVEAESAYRKAIELDATWDVPWCDLGDLLSNKFSRYEDAAFAYRKAIELNPDRVKYQIGLGNLLQDQLKEYNQAELAYREAIRLDSEEAIPVANLARLLTKMGRNQEASALYRESLKLAEEDDQNVILQAHCWLGNSDLAIQSLDKLAESASKGNSEAFFKLKEQCFECHAIGLSMKVVDLMERSRFANFLMPFSLALRFASGEKDALLDAAVEVRGMAEDVLLQINGVT